MIRNKDNLENHPIYDIDTDMGSAMFNNGICPQENVLKPSKDARDKSSQ